MPEIYVASKVFVEVYEYSYENGEEDYANSWDFSLPRRVFSSKADLIEAINEAVYLDVKDVTFYDGKNGKICFSVMVDVDNQIPSESQLEAWRNGEEKLYIADGSMTAMILPERMRYMTSEDAKMFGIAEE